MPPQNLPRIVTPPPLPPWGPLTLRRSGFLSERNPPPPPAPARSADGRCRAPPPVHCMRCTRPGPRCPHQTRPSARGEESAGDRAGGGGPNPRTGAELAAGPPRPLLLFSRSGVPRPPPSPSKVRLGSLAFGSAGPGPRDAFEGKGPQRRPQQQLGRRLEEVAEVVGGGYCRLQTPLKPALGVRGTVAGHRLGALEEGGEGYLHPFQCIPGRGQGGGGGLLLSGLRQTPRRPPRIITHGCSDQPP